MSREAHVRICEGVGVRFPHATRRKSFYPSLSNYAKSPCLPSAHYSHITFGSVFGGQVTQPAQAQSWSPSSACQGDNPVFLPKGV